MNLGDSYEESDEEELIKIYIETHQFYRRLKKEVKNSDLMYEHTNKAGATNFIKNPLLFSIPPNYLVCRAGSER
ncbi:hypothetical protein ERL59_02370 [Chengkuizengella sp. YPA3-1-1]|uniref:Uncharacterized protein n=1 Tax=Chengkuizengella marina TaxID=2507566 RepID=A0A6N9PXV2_9BACL|nr:hypothetical protein [Chengkuizengella marina]